MGRAAIRQWKPSRVDGLRRCLDCVKSAVTSMVSLEPALRGDAVMATALHARTQSWTRTVAHLGMLTTRMQSEWLADPRLQDAFSAGTRCRVHAEKYRSLALTRLGQIPQRTLDAPDKIKHTTLHMQQRSIMALSRHIGT